MRQLGGSLVFHKSASESGLRGDSGKQCALPSTHSGRAARPQRPSLRGAFLNLYAHRTGPLPPARRAKKGAIAVVVGGQLDPSWSQRIAVEGETLAWRLDRGASGRRKEASLRHSSPCTSLRCLQALLLTPRLFSPLHPPDAPDTPTDGLFSFCISADFDAAVPPPSRRVSIESLHPYLSREAGAESWTFGEWLAGSQAPAGAPSPCTRLLKWVFDPRSRTEDGCDFLECAPAARRQSGY